MTADEYFFDGNRLFRDHLYWAALLRYRQAYESGMDTPLLHYNTGVAHYRAKQHIRARESFLRALESPALRISTQYSLGLNAYAIGDYAEALRWLRLARDQQENDRIAEYARVAIARVRAARDRNDPVQIEEEKRQREFRFTDLELSAEVSFGSDDNVFRSPDEPYNDFSDPALPLVTPTVQSGAYMPVDLRALYRINALKFEGFYGAYRLAGRYYQDKELDNANEFSHELSFGSEYRRKNEETGRERRVWSAFKIAQHDEVYYDPDDGSARTSNNVNLEDRLDYLRYGPELLLRQSWDRFAVALQMKGQLWNYEQTEQVPEYDHEYFFVNAYAQYRFTSTSLLRVAAAKSSRRFGDRRSRELDGTLDINNPNLRYDYLDLSLLARQRITRKLWFGVEYERAERVDQYVGYNDYTRDSYGAEINLDIGDRFEIEIEGFYRLYDFPNAFAFNNPAAGRKTLETAEGTVQVTYRMTRHLDLILEAEYREKESTDSRIAYERMQYVLGVRWQQ
ncbi:MAG: hypothetical protein R3288_07250 [Woeseiaceae bacterium]|nr:hypothetical protein [Woeseiaceae bacterium]